MKAAVIYGAKDLKVEDIQEPTVQAGEVKVKVAWTGICGSDLHAYHHGMGVSDTPHPVSGRQLPLTLGHEFAGIVTEIGEGVTKVKVGDRVAVEPIIYAEDDYYVKLGKYNLASTFGFLGLNADGGFAQYAVGKESAMHKLPDNVSLEEGALVEPTAVALQAVKSSVLKAGQTAIVLGAGPIGLLTVIAAKAAGASDVIVVDVSPERLEKAKEVGATLVINPMEEDVAQKIYSIYPHGIDVAYEAAGAQATFDTAIKVLKKGGQLMIIAAFAKPVQMDAFTVLVGELDITASLAYRHIFPEVIAMISSGRLDVKPVITKKIAIDNIIEDGLELLITDKSQAKILVDVQA